MYQKNYSSNDNPKQLGFSENIISHKRPAKIVRKLVLVGPVVFITNLRQIILIKKVNLLLIPAVCLTALYLQVLQKGRIEFLPSRLFFYQA